MAQSKKPCKNHPDRLTARRCYYCKEPICSECQLHFEHHLFCSKKCYHLWKKEQILKKLKSIKHLEVWILLIFFVFSLTVFFFYFNHRINKIAQNALIQKPLERQDSLWFSMDTTLKRVEGSLTFRLKGNARAAVSLWQDGRLVAMQSNGRALNRFSNIHLHFGGNHFVLWEHLATGKTVLIDSFTVNWGSARLIFMSRSLNRVPIKQKKLALTFDAGSTDRGSLKILDILRNKGVHCTMFVTGQFIRHYPQVVRQIVLDGHEVGDHTFSHPHLTTYAQNARQEVMPGVTFKFVNHQLLKVDSLFYRLTGRHLAPYWRAPFGEYNNHILLWAAESGFKHVGWSAYCDALDWVADSTSDLYRTSQDILNHFLRLEKKSGLRGKIILMHLGSDRKSDFPYFILPALIDSLRNRGYEFCKISTLIDLKEQSKNLARNR